jgi:hypothetical protein
MKIQVGANLVVIGSGKLAKENPACVKAAMTPAEGKRRAIQVVLPPDDNGYCAVFTLPVKTFSTGSFGAYLSGKADATLVDVELPVTKAEVKSDKAAAKMQALTDELLGA